MYLDHLDVDNPDPDNLDVHHPDLDHVDLDHPDLDHLYIDNLDLDHVDLDHVDLGHLDTTFGRSEMLRKTRPYLWTCPQLFLRCFTHGMDVDHRCRPRSSRCYVCRYEMLCPSGLIQMPPGK